jgi:hypothetical protein
MIRGGATRDPDVRAFLKEKGYRWNGQRFCWEWYSPSNADFRDILVELRDRFGCEVVPKEGLDAAYVIDLEGVSHG